ncbi:hypothetical protein CMV_027678, partial [Castanea mollissima]
LLRQKLRYGGTECSDYLYRVFFKRIKSPSSYIILLYIMYEKAWAENLGEQKLVLLSGF